MPVRITTHLIRMQNDFSINFAKSTERVGFELGKPSGRMTGWREGRLNKRDLRF